MPKADSESVNEQSASVGSEENVLLSERFWYALDRQMLGSGLRLILILPAFSIFTSFGALAFSSSSPEWWSKIEPTLGMSFALALTALTFIILLGYILVQIFHRHRVELSIRNFEKEVNLVGYSLGGTIANNLLTTKNKKINKVILIDPWFSNNTTVDSAAFKLLGFIEKREKNGWKEVEDAQKYSNNMNPDLNLDQNESIGINRFEYDINVWDSSIQKGTLIQKEQSKFDNPTLLIKPASSLIRESQIRKLENNFSNLSVDEISGTTHMIIFEKPNDVSNKITTFIR